MAIGPKTRMILGTATTRDIRNEAKFPGTPVTSDDPLTVNAPVWANTFGRWRQGAVVAAPGGRRIKAVVEFVRNQDGLVVEKTLPVHLVRHRSGNGYTDARSVS